MENLYYCRYNVCKKVENIVAKGGIARFEQFILLLRCFQKPSAGDASNCVCMWERVKGDSVDQMLDFFKMDMSSFAFRRVQRKSNECQNKITEFSSKPFFLSLVLNC